MEYGFKYFLFIEMVFCIIVKLWWSGCTFFLQTFFISVLEFFYLLFTGPLRLYKEIANNNKEYISVIFFQKRFQENFFLLLNRIQILLINFFFIYDYIKIKFFIFINYIIFTRGWKNAVAGIFFLIILSHFIFMNRYYIYILYGPSSGCILYVKTVKIVIRLEI